MFGRWNTVGEGAREKMREKGRKERWGLGLFWTLVHKTINPPLMEDVQVNPSILTVFDRDPILFFSISHQIIILFSTYRKKRFPINQNIVKIIYLHTNIGIFLGHKLMFWSFLLTIGFETKTWLFSTKP